VRLHCFTKNLISCHFVCPLKRYEQNNPGLSISDDELGKCVCPCIRPEKVSDCACPTCIDMQCSLRSLREVIGCENCKSGSWGAISSVWDFAKMASCQPKPIPMMEREGCSEEFHMRPLRCCVSEGDIKNFPPCADCRIEVRLDNASCACFSSENLNRDVCWLKRQDTIEGKNHDKIVSRLRSYKGTVSELLACVKSMVKPYLYHLWRARFLRRQFHLDCDYFEPETECLLLADFASAMVRSFYHV
jgi:hypothetical protein